MPLSQWQHLESKPYRTVKPQLWMSSATGSERYAKTAQRAVQLDAGLVQVMAASGVGSTLMARAANS
jgi:hypothetical protein